MEVQPDVSAGIAVFSLPSGAAAEAPKTPPPDDFTKKTNAAENAAERTAAMEIIFCIDATKSNAARAAGKK